MLASAGRTTVRRLATIDLPKTTTYHFAHGSAARQSFLRILNAYNGFALGQQNFDKAFAIEVTRRLFATAATAPAKPKKPTSTSASRTTKTTKATAKKDASKAAKKPAAKKKVTPKKKKTTLKKKTVKRPMTPEQKEKAKAKEKRDLIRKLKALALQPPKLLPQSAWQLLTSETAKQVHGIPGTAASAKYKSLTPAELEHYNHIANQNKATNQATLRQWVESHTPEQIRIANNARVRLKHLKAKRVVHKIQDDRQVRRPLPPFVRFTKDRWESGDFHNMKIPDAQKLIAHEYKEISESQKKKYRDDHDADKLRYQQESKTVYGHSLSPPPKAKAPSTS